MENNTKKGTEAEAAKEPKKKQAVSKTYLIRSFGQNIGKLETLGLVTTEDAEQLKKIYKEVTTKYIEQSMTIL